jgi:HlyD family secretion protein
VVLTRSAEVGDAVGANSLVMTLGATGRTELVIEPDERNLSLLRVGQRALASAEAFPDQRFEARVSFIAPSVDSRRGTIEVRLEVPDAPDYLRPDMTVSVDIEIMRKPDALTVPVSAVVDMASDAPYVLVVEDGRATRTPVTLGIEDSRRAEILSGLDGTEQVIRQPAGISAGARVRARAVTP